MCFDFLYIIVWNISHSKKISESYDQKRSQVFMKDTRPSWLVLMKL
jgi:hypothetical protein